MTLVLSPKLLGCEPDAPDKRDYPVSAIAVLPRKLPKAVPILPKLPRRHQQGGIPLCVGNATASQISYGHTKQGLPDPDPSRMFLSYNARDIEGSAHELVGTSIRSCIKAASKLGVCNETTWPYIEQMATITPSSFAYVNALKDRVLSYYRIIGQREMKVCLANGFPFIFGVAVYENWPMQTPNGLIPMPQGLLLGWHAIWGVGYDQIGLHFANSWGDEWGDHGLGYLPWSYLTPDKCGDMWTIRLVQ
jgi:hypothetical protein